MPAQALVADVTENISDVAKEMMKEVDKHASHPLLHLTIPRITLHALLQTVAGASGGSGSADILKNVLIQAGKTGLAVVATNMELSAIAISHEPTIMGDGMVVVPLKTLQQVANLAGDDIILQEQSDGGLRIVSDDSVWLESIADHDLFPAVPTISSEAQPIPTRILLDSLRIVSPAIGSDDSRPSLMMVKFEDDGLYSTDGSRVHFAAMESNPMTEARMHIPANAVKPLISLLASCPEDYIYVEATDSTILFKLGPHQFHARLMDVDFPMVKTSIVTPKLENNKIEIQIARGRLDLALKRAATVSDGTVTLSFKESFISVGTSNVRGSQALTKVDATGYGQNQPRALTYSLEALQDLVSVLKADIVTFKLSPNTQDGSLLVVDDKNLSVVMPKVYS